MKYCTVRLSQPDWMLHPMQRFIREESVVRYEELQAWAIATGDALEYELFYVEAAREPYEDALAAVDSVRWYDLTPIDDDSFYVYICQETRGEDVRWREAFAALNLVVIPPIVYDPTAAFYMTVVGSGDNLQAMLEGLPDEIDVTVRAIGDYDRRHAPLVGDLTDRQLEPSRWQLTLATSTCLARLASAMLPTNWAVRRVRPRRCFRRPRRG